MHMNFKFNSNTAIFHELMSFYSYLERQTIFKNDMLSYIRIY